MLRSMFTAISSLTSHQAWMDLVGNNLSNVNTPGFKYSKISFQDQVSQTMRSGTSPSDVLGGINPMQVGLGMRLGSIGINFMQGALQSTGRSSDMAIQGDGFFMYSTTLRDNATATATAGSTASNVSGQRYYSRDGTVDMDANGYLVNSNTGLRLLGWTPISTSTSGSDAYVDTGQQLQAIQIPVNSTLASRTNTTTLRGNIDSTQPLNQPVSVTMGIYDSLGQAHNATVQFTRTGNNTWNWTASYVDSLGATQTINSAAPLVFNTTGQVQSGGSQNLAISFQNGTVQPQTVTLDLTNLTQLSTDNSAYLSYQDGLAAGALTGFHFETNTGRVIAVYSNGLQRFIAQVGMTSFANPAGLVKVGDNLYQDGLNSGPPNVGLADTGGRGVIVPAYVEASNVDLAQEFTNMILAQRGFQASSRMITTSDEMLQELVNLKR